MKCEVSKVARKPASWIILADPASLEADLKHDRLKATQPQA